MTAQELNRQLCALHIQYYQSGQYMLYADYAHMGLAQNRTHYHVSLASASSHTPSSCGRRGEGNSYTRK